MKKLWIVFSVFLCFALSGCNTDEDMQAQYDLEYQEGYDAAYNEGYYDGKADAYDDYINAEYTDECEISYFPYQVRTKKTGLSLRTEPSSAAEKIVEIPMYEYIGVTDFSDDGKWGHIYYGSVDGWVNLDYCEDTYDILVYVTEYGGKYHKKGCRYLTETTRIIPFSQIGNREPCKGCGGYGIP